MEIGVVGCSVSVSVSWVVCAGTVCDHNSRWYEQDFVWELVYWLVSMPA